MSALRRVQIWLLALLLGSLAPAGTWAAVAQDTVPDAALEARVNQVSAELRCLVCQNQTLADSHAGLAVDLKNQVREQLRAGRSPQLVIDYMTERYGDFVRYRPPFKPSTWLLWLGPLLLVGAGLLALWRALGRQARVATAPLAAMPAGPDGDASAATARVEALLSARDA